MIRMMRKLAFCICENNGADQICVRSGRKPRSRFSHEAAHMFSFSNISGAQFEINDVNVSLKF